MSAVFPPSSAFDSLKLKPIRKISSGKNPNHYLLLMSLSTLAACSGSAPGRIALPPVTPPVTPPVASADFIENPANTFTARDNAGRTLDQAAATADLVVIGGDGADTITTGSGADIIRGGLGADTIVAGDGDDAIVVVGATVANQYAASAITDPAGTGVDLSGVLSLATLNARGSSEAVAGEVIDGGAGLNKLYVYGVVDFTGVTLTNVSQVIVNSDVTFSNAQLGTGKIDVIRGDGGSIIRIESTGGAATVDLAQINITGVNNIEIGSSVTLSASAVAALSAAGVSVISGAGTIQLGVAGSSVDLTGFIVESTTVFTDLNGVAVDPASVGAIIATPAQIQAGQSPTNQAPTAMSLTLASVSEAGGGATLGTLSTTDADTNDIHVHTLNDPRFLIVGNTLKVKPDQIFDFSTANSVSVDIVTKDAAGHSITTTVTIPKADILKANVAPVIISPSIADAKDGIGYATRIVAFDNNIGDSKTFSIVGGADQSHFMIDPTTGYLNFTAAPDFASPLDVDGNNTYEVQVQVTDSNGATASQNLIVRVNPNTVVTLTNGDDSYFGTAANESIAGVVGDDIIYGFGGSDLISDSLTNTGTVYFNGGDGNDFLFIDGLSDFTLVGGKGDDIIQTTGSGIGYIFGGAGNDSIVGSTGSEEIDGGAGDDYIDAGNGSDYVYISQNGSDTITLGSGDDIIQLFGSSSGHHVVKDFTLNDYIDLITISELAGGIPGTDFSVNNLDIIDTPQGALFTLAPDHTILFEGRTAAEMKQSFIFNLPRIVGGSGNDILSSDDIDAGGSTVLGGPGDDVLSVGAKGLYAQDYYNGVRLAGGLGNDTITGADHPLIDRFGIGGSNLIEGNQGNDILIGGGGDVGWYDFLHRGYDTVTYEFDPAGINANFLTGQVIDGWGDTDTVSGFEEVILSYHDDMVTTGDQNMIVSKADKGDTIVQAGAGFVTVYGNGMNFTANAAGSAIVFDGFSQAVIDSQVGTTTVLLNLSQDAYIYLGAGVAGLLNGIGTKVDTITGVENAGGGDGADTIVGSDGDNIIAGNYNVLDSGNIDGSDTLTGGLGSDTFITNRTNVFANVDVITDFQVGTDKLGLYNATLSLVTFVQGTGANVNDTLVMYGGQFVAVLQNVTATSLSIADLVSVKLHWWLPNEKPFNTRFTTASFDQNIAEGTVFVGNINAIDLDGDTLTYSIAGADAALFTVDSVTGAVNFIAAPVYASPTDANGDNVYELTIISSDGQYTDSLDVTITVDNPSPVTVGEIVELGVEAQILQDLGQPSPQNSIGMDADGQITPDLVRAEEDLFHFGSAPNYDY